MLPREQVCLLQEEDIRAGCGYEVSKIEDVAANILDVEGGESERPIDEAHIEMCVGLAGG